MKYYLAMSKRDKDYIIMEESGYYQWYKDLPIQLHTAQNRDSIFISVDDWLSKLPVHNMQLLHSFDDYSIFRQNFPEYFI